MSSSVYIPSAGSEARIRSSKLTMTAITEDSCMHPSLTLLKSPMLKHGSFWIPGDPAASPLRTPLSARPMLDQLDSILAKIEERITALETGRRDAVDKTLAHFAETKDRIRSLPWSEKVKFVLGHMEGRYGSVASRAKVPATPAPGTTFVPETPGPRSYKEKMAAALSILEKKLEALDDKAVANVRDLRHEKKQDVDTIERAKALYKTRHLYFDELPPAWQENCNIHKGYRFCDGPIACFASFAHVHNESCNIWTHFSGLIFVLFLAFYVYPSTAAYAAGTTLDRIIFSGFLVAAAKCMFCSTIYHTMNGIGHLRSRMRASCMDYVGISILIAATVMTVEYNSFYCQVAARNFYMTFTGITGAIGVVIPWMDWFDKKENRKYRIAFFVCLASSAFVPIIHMDISHGIIAGTQFFAPEIPSLMAYCLGLYFYANRYPEKLFPGYFDFIGASHNIWHCSIVVAIYLHYLASLRFHETREAFSCAV